MGKTFKTEAGRRLRTEGLLGAGGEGCTYAATDLKSGEKGVIKLFHQNKFDPKLRLERIRFLVSLKLQQACSALNAPMDPIIDGKEVGHFSPWADGENLEDFASPRTFMDDAFLAFAIAIAFDTLHKSGIAHGDIQAGNIKVHKTPDGPIAAKVIDLDNFQVKGVAPPFMIGHELYLSPEARMARRKKLALLPCQNTDLYSLGVIFHEILLGVHPSSGADHDQATLDAVVESGWSLHDPLNPRHAPGRGNGGSPWEVLDSRLSALLRDALSANPERRPRAEAWRIALSEAVWKVFPCPRCGGCIIIDPSKTVCPFTGCRKPYPGFTLRTKSGIAIPIDRGMVLLGRDECGGSMKVSSRHATLRKIGPETWLEPHGSNGTRRWTGREWLTLQRPVVLNKGDRIKFADVEAEVLELN